MSLGGVTSLFASNKYDCGDIISQKSFEIKYPLKIIDAIKQIEPLYFELVSEIFIKIKKDKKIKASIQNEDKATYSSWLDSKDYFIDWTWSAEKIKRFIDAVGYPYDNAKSTINGKIVNIIDAEVEEDKMIENRKRHVGKIVFINDGNPVVICGRGLIRLKDIKNIEEKEVFLNFRTRFE